MGFMAKEDNYDYDFDIISLYKELGIRREVLDFGREVEVGLAKRFAGMAIMTWDGIRWKRFMLLCSIRKVRWCARRLLAAPMRWRWRLARI